VPVCLLLLAYDQTKHNLWNVIHTNSNYVVIHHYRNAKVLLWFRCSRRRDCRNSIKEITRAIRKKQIIVITRLSVVSTLCELTEKTAPAHMLGINFGDLTEKTTLRRFLGASSCDSSSRTNSDCCSLCSLNRSSFPAEGGTKKAQAIGLSFLRGDLTENRTPIARMKTWCPSR
jgi:hypothetical protein